MKRTSANDPVIKKFKQAGTWLYRESNWLGALALSFDDAYIESDDPSITFLATDGVSLYYNKARVLQESIENVALCIAHEVGHCQGGHFARRGARDPGKWNVATDHAVNNLLKSAAMHVPNTWLCNPKYDGWSAERIYLDLPDDPGKNDPNGASQDGQVLDAPSGQPAPQSSQPSPGQPDASANGDPQPGDGDPQPGQGDGDGGPNQQREKDQQQAAQRQAAQELAQQWQDRAAEAQITARAKGNLPSNLDRMISDARDPARDWRATMEHLATDPAHQDRRFSPPNRRHIWNGLIMPSNRGHEIGTLALFIDTSGSIYGPILAEFIGKGRDMLECGSIGELVIIACDARAHFMGRYMRGDTIPLTTLPGGGGTNFAPPFEMLEEMDIQPTAAAYLTDLQGKFPEMPPPYPVMWLTIEPGTAPFGEVLDA